MRWVAGAIDAPEGEYDADVVILALNRTEETLAAIRSALAQIGVTRHVFVVDQGSEPAALARFAAAVAQRTDATLVAASSNLGVPGGRNRGAALGHGRVITALDNDAEFATTETLMQMVAALDQDASLAVIACRIVQYATGDDDLSSWGYPIGLLPLAGKSFDAATFVGAGHAIRRSAWDALGGYDAALFFCWEEFDLSVRVTARGWRIRYRGDIVVRHKVSGENRVGWSGERWFYFVRNRLYIGRKYGGGWLGLTPRMAGYLIKGVRNRLLGATLRALPAAIRMAATLPKLSAPVALGQLDAVHRGSWLTRLMQEVLVPLPTARARSDGRRRRVRMPIDTLL
jgi:GT2 family glycosyltransferase